MPRNRKTARNGLLRADTAAGIKGISKYASRAAALLFIDIEKAGKIASPALRVLFKNQMRPT